MNKQSKDIRYLSPRKLDYRSDKLMFAAKMVGAISMIFAVTILVLLTTGRFESVFPYSIPFCIGMAGLTCLASLSSTYTLKASNIRSSRIANPEPRVRILEDGKGSDYHSNEPVEVHKGEVGQKMPFARTSNSTVVQIGEVFVRVPNELCVEIPFPV